MVTNHRRDSGFTLIELTVVVWMMGVLIIVGMFTYTTIHRGNELEKVSTSVTEIGKTLTTGAQNNGSASYDGSTLTVTIPERETLTVKTLPETTITVIPSNNAPSGAKFTDVPLTGSYWCASTPSPRYTSLSVQINSKAAYLNKETTAC